MTTLLMKYLKSAVIAMLLLPIVVSGQTKLAQTGFQFLSVGPDARAAAMGGAFTTVEGYGTAVFFNPAGMARLENTAEVMASQTSWIADINQYAFSAAYRPFGGRFGTIAFSALHVDYGDVEGTMVSGNPNGYVETGILNPSALGIGVGYATFLTDRFSVGAHIKHVSQYLGESAIPEKGVQKNIAKAVAFDFGTIYRTNFRGFAFGMSVRNFSEEIKYEEEGFQLPLTFKIGVSMDAFQMAGIQSSSQNLLVTVDAVHPRAFNEYINVGAEYSVNNTLKARVGYATGQSDYGVAAGFGVQQFGIQFDYAYTPFTVFNDVHRFSIKFGI